MSTTEKKHMQTTSSKDPEDKEAHATSSVEVVDKDHQTHAMPSQPVDDFRPCIRSGVFAHIGGRSSMEDRHVLMDDVGLLVVKDSDMQLKSVPTSFYAVFDGHGGAHAAEFAQNHLFSIFIKRLDELKDIPSALTCAFIETDTQFKDAWLENKSLASGTTALAAVISGNKIYVANAGDCRAVLCRNGKALDLSVDHAPRNNRAEYDRIIQAGGYLVKGYLNDIVNMSRAIGDWDETGLKGPGPLISAPEIRCERLTKEDEFLIIASDGLFEHASSENAVDSVRHELQKHQNLESCVDNLVNDTQNAVLYPDNTTIVIVSFQKEVTIGPSA